MTHPNPAVTHTDTMTMFWLTAQPDGTAGLTVISRDSNGRLWQSDYRMDPLMSYALRLAVRRELNDVPTPPPVTTEGLRATLAALAQAASAA
ncbi:hypothetical protein OG607_27385 [Streptomyces sp. NBC_01537]|uniref:hypothetical protein n=1 Tax=Streptomyces sp. NBC_01537 TaxID=2903896 RepID=UPI00386F986A